MSERFSLASKTTINFEPSNFFKSPCNILVMIKAAAVGIPFEFVKFCFEPKKLCKEMKNRQRVLKVKNQP